MGIITITLALIIGWMLGFLSFAPITRKADEWSERKKDEAGWTRKWKKEENE